jgi:hypothetical protein
MPARDHALLTRVLCALTVAASAGLFTAAVLVPAPAAVLPLVVAVCIGFPMLATWELRATVGVPRDAGDPLDSRAIARLRRHLDELPETRHPLGL